jgi:hypothetical protein
VRVHDFKLPELGKVAPYGVYDIAANHGWVSIGVDAYTAAFAVEATYSTPRVELHQRPINNHLEAVISLQVLTIHGRRRS